MHWREFNNPIRFQTKYFNVNKKVKSVLFQGLTIDRTATVTSATTKTTPLEEINIVFKKGTMHTYTHT